MDIELKETKNTLFIVPKGELDHNFLKKHRERTEMKIATTQKNNIVIDLDSLNFMDSSGISFVFDAYKTALSTEKKLFVVTKNKKYKKILTLAKMEKFVKITSEFGEEK